MGRRGEEGGGGSRDVVDEVAMSLMEKPGFERGDGRKLGWSTGVDTGEVYSASEGSGDEIDRDRESDRERSREIDRCTRTWSSS